MNPTEINNFMLSSLQNSVIKHDSEKLKFCNDVIEEFGDNDFVIQMIGMGYELVNTKPF